MIAVEIVRDVEYVYAIMNISMALLHGLTLIPTWKRIYIHYKMWDEMTYPFPNINGCTSMDE